MPADMKVTIDITGLAIVNPRTQGSNMQVLFLHPDSHHRIELKTVRAGTNPFTVTEKLRARSKMEFKITPGVKVKTPVPDDHPEYLANIRELHSPNTLSIKSSPNLDKSFLSIPANTFGARVVTNLPHTFWKFNPSANPHVKPLKAIMDQNVIPGEVDGNVPFGKRVGKEVKISFLVPEGESITLEFQKPLKRTATFDYEENISYTLRFDNECKGHPCINDFGYYYELYKDDDDGSEIDEVPNRPPAELTPGTDLQAACNPIEDLSNCDLGLIFEDKPCP